MNRTDQKRRTSEWLLLTLSAVLAPCLWMQTATIEDLATAFESLDLENETQARALSNIHRHLLEMRTAPSEPEGAKERRGGGF